MVFPQILCSILNTTGNSSYGRVETGGCWPLFPLQLLAFSGVGQAADLGLAFQAAKEKNTDNHKTEPLTWIYPIRPPNHLGTVNISDGVQCKVWAPSHHLLSQLAGEQVLTLAKTIFTYPAPMEQDQVYKILSLSVFHSVSKNISLKIHTLLSLTSKHHL